MTPTPDRLELAMAAARVKQLWVRAADVIGLERPSDMRRMEAQLLDESA